MAIAHTPEPFSEDEDRLRQILLDAELPSLMPALAQVTGDLSLVDRSLRPHRRLTAAGVDPQAGITPEAQVRAAGPAALPGGRVPAGRGPRTRAGHRADGVRDRGRAR
jgi:hypothetical protein